MPVGGLMKFIVIIRRGEIGIIPMKKLSECSIKIFFLNVMICTFLNVISKKVVIDFEKTRKLFFN